MFNACNASDAVIFVSKYRIHSEMLARQIEVPTENILGLAAHESQYGLGRFAAEGNNFFFHARTSAHANRYLDRARRF